MDADNPAQGVKIARRNTFEPDSVTRATASDWQLKQAMRLAEELALLRPGTAPHEISRQTLRRVRRVQRAWAALWKELRARSRTPVNTPASEAGGRPFLGRQGA